MIKKEVFGAYAINLSFNLWYEFFFKTIWGHNYIYTKGNDKILNLYSDIYNGKFSRTNLNAPARVSKTETAIGFLIYSCLKSKCNWIYTSSSKSILNEVRCKIENVFKNEDFLSFYPGVVYQEQEELIKFEDDFFEKEFTKEQTEEKAKLKFSSKKIVISGSQILLIPRGSIIAGLPAGRTTDKEEFTGGIIMDDIDKIDETRFSKVIRDKLHSWYSAEVLSRLEDKKAPIINIQHRCCLEDMSGYLQKVYNFKTFAFPLVDEKGEVQFLKKKYDVEELKKDNFRWNALYLQQPIADGGNLIKSSWFNFTNTPPKVFDYVYMTCDTAYSTKTSADNSVLLLCGLAGHNLYLLDCKVGKWSFVDLKQNLFNFYQHSKQIYNNFSNIYIENKASGQSLLQELKSVGLPVEGVLPTVNGKTQEYTADKYKRLMEVISDINNGYVYINAGRWNEEFVNECESFTGDGSTHDDRVDTLIYALKVRRNLLFNRPLSWADINKRLFYNV